MALNPTGWKTAERFIGMWKGAPDNEPIAREHDKHLHSDLCRHTRDPDRARALEVFETLQGKNLRDLLVSTA